MGVTWGVSAWFHDAGLSVIKDGNIVFAGHAERYSGKKHDKMLNKKIIDEALSFGKPNQVAWYEKPWKKNLRKFWSGEWRYSPMDKHPNTCACNFVRSSLHTCNSWILHITF